MIDAAKGCARGWPPQRRRAQAARIKIIRPWLYATGPKTIAGKQASARNACRHGFRSAAMDATKKFLREQRIYIKALWLDIGRDMFQNAGHAAAQTHNRYFRHGRHGRAAYRSARVACVGAGG